MANNKKEKVITDFWACQRPMGQYKGIYPGGILKRIDQLIGLKNKKVLLLKLGILTISVVVVFGIVRNPQTDSENATNTNLEDIIKSGKTWNASFTSWAGISGVSSFE